MELGTTDPMTSDKKTFIFYPLLAISPQNLPWLDHNSKHGSDKKQEIQKNCFLCSALILISIKAGPTDSQGYPTTTPRALF